VEEEADVGFVFPGDDKEGMGWELGEGYQRAFVMGGRKRREGGLLFELGRQQGPAGQDRLQV
jgi:hypothetical protein